MNRLTANMPLVWAVLAGLAMAVLPFFIPDLRNLLGIVPLTFGEWLQVAGIALSLLAVVEVGNGSARRSMGTIDNLKNNF